MQIIGYILILFISIVFGFIFVGHIYWLEQQPAFSKPDKDINRRKQGLLDRFRQKVGMYFLSHCKTYASEYVFNMASFNRIDLDHTHEIIFGSDYTQGIRDQFIQFMAKGCGYKDLISPEQFDELSRLAKQLITLRLTAHAIMSSCEKLPEPFIYIFKGDHLIFIEEFLEFLGSHNALSENSQGSADDDSDEAENACDKHTCHSSTILDGHKMPTCFGCTCNKKSTEPPYDEAAATAHHEEFLKEIDTM